MRRHGRIGGSWHAGEVLVCVPILAGLLALGGGHHTAPGSPGETLAAASSAPMLGALTTVSCTSARRCLAVGYRDNGSGITPLAEIWDGTTWALMATPIPKGAASGSLSGLSCSGPNACLAVGSDASKAQQKSGDTSPLAETWNGKAWKIRIAVLPKHATSGSLLGTSCTAKTCVAVGYSGRFAYDGKALAEMWNGNTWKVTTIPKPKGAVADTLYGVSCHPAHDCLAVGYWATEDEYRVATGAPLAEVWHGGASWKITPVPPSDSLLSGVSCTSAKACMAVGDNGLGTGGFYTESEQWNGTRWRSVPIATRLDSSSLGGVSCHSADACLTVGSYDTNDAEAAYVTLAEAWNGQKRKWTILPSRNPASAASSFLEGVSCWSADGCVAVGRDASTSQVDGGTSVPLAERWNGTRWSIMAAAPAATHVRLASSPSTTWTASDASASSTLTATFAEDGQAGHLEVTWETTARTLS